MLDSIMLLCIGFLAAGMLTLSLIPLVHARAVRLTTRRYRDTIPTSVTDMQAEKDRLRATFAMSIRRLEIALEEARAKAASQLCEIAKKAAEIQRLKTELGKVPADHRCEIVKKSNENHSLRIELSHLAAPMRSLPAPERIRRSVTRYRKPTAKWAACATASGLIVSLLLLGLSSDRQNQLGRTLALMIGGNFAGQAGATKASAWEGRGGMVAAKEAGTIGHADAAKIQGEAAPQRTTTRVVIIRGGRREEHALNPPKKLPAP